MPTKPSCFITYTWENDTKHQSWVLELAKRVRDSGVEVRIDRWNTKPGDDLTRFMETGIRDSDFVIIVCTPEYARQTHEGAGGAAYEKRLISGELLEGKPSSKFIPLIRKGPNKEALPSYLKASKYIDFRDDSKFKSKLEELLDHLHGSSKATQQMTTGSQSQRTPIGITGPPTEPFILPPPLSMILGNSNKPKPSAMSLVKMAGKSMVYCSRCGIQPGLQTICIGVNTAHNFVRGDEVIYCECCGQKAGSKTLCIGLRIVHNFKSRGIGTEVCIRCGLEVGTRSTCTGINLCHTFATV